MRLSYFVCITEIEIVIRERSVVFSDPLLREIGMLLREKWRSFLPAFLDPLLNVKWILAHI